MCFCTNLVEVIGTMLHVRCISSLLVCTHAVKRCITTPISSRGVHTYTALQFVLGNGFRTLQPHSELSRHCRAADSATLEGKGLRGPDRITSRSPCEHGIRWC